MDEEEYMEVRDDEIEVVEVESGVRPSTSNRIWETEE